jgi:hypothetical protein
MDVVADIAEKYAQDEIRVTHSQNLVLAHIRKADLYAVWQALDAADLATPNLDLVTDIIVCPGMDYCTLANARSIPIAQKIAAKFENDSAAQQDLGELKIKISGCINGCDHGGIERLVGREAVEPDAAHETDLIDQHIAGGADFAGKARFAQDARRRIATAVAEFGEGDFDELEPVQMRRQRAHILARFDANSGEIAASEEIGKRSDRTFERPIVTEAQPCRCIVERRRGGTCDGLLVLVIGHKRLP